MVYSVRWVHTKNKWATRWDSILEMDNYEHETNWSSLINTILLLLLLGFLVAVILLRAGRSNSGPLTRKIILLQDREKTNFSRSRLLAPASFRCSEKRLCCAEGARGR